jgi:hypothetical protein
MTDIGRCATTVVEVMNMAEPARITVRCVEHNRLLEIFYRDFDGWAGLILSNAGDARSGHDAIVAAEHELGVPDEVIQRRHLVRRGTQWINRHRGGVDRTALGFEMECGGCKRPSFHFRNPVFGQLLDGLAAQGTYEIDVHALVSLYRGAPRVL